MCFGKIGLETQRLVIVRDGVGQPIRNFGEGHAKIVVPTRGMGLPRQAVFPYPLFTAVIVISPYGQRAESYRCDADDGKGFAATEPVNQEGQGHHHRRQGQIHSAFRHRLLRNRHYC